MRERETERQRESEKERERETETERERQRDRETERQRDRDRDVELLFIFLNGMTGALAPFSYLVYSGSLNFYEHSNQHFIHSKKVSQILFHSCYD